LIAPVEAPRHKTLVCEVIATVGNGVTVTFTLALAVSPLPSVTVTV
jgi:hypothetical protein